MFGPPHFSDQSYVTVYTLWTVESEARNQRMEAAAADDGKKTIDNKENALTSSYDTFLPFDVTSGKSRFSAFNISTISSPQQNTRVAFVYYLQTMVIFLRKN